MSCVRGGGAAGSSKGPAREAAALRRKVLLRPAAVERGRASSEGGAPLGRRGVESRGGDAPSSSVGCGGLRSEKRGSAAPGSEGDRPWGDGPPRRAMEAPTLESRLGDSACEGGLAAGANPAPVGDRAAPGAAPSGGAVSACIMTSREGLVLAPVGDTREREREEGLDCVSAGGGAA
jgi:hypothetical protein